MEIRYSLCLPRDAATVPVVRNMIGAGLERLGVEQDCTSDVKVAVTEACSNVLKHTAGTQNEYSVEIEIDEFRCRIRVVDTGAGFDHASIGGGDADASSESGRGIQLMRALVDDLKFVSESELGTVVQLTKTLRLTSESVIHRLMTGPGKLPRASGSSPR
ncbi:MAG TPA: ATP-binding protein [Actinomycetota bacterium]|jgi:serine/threonine-protein kinase RsbW|nr:ATP-binding protein [Actinomycetota bacterium]